MKPIPTEIIDFSEVINKLFFEERRLGSGGLSSKSSVLAVNDGKKNLEKECDLMLIIWACQKELLKLWSEFNWVLQV